MTLGGRTACCDAQTDVKACTVTAAMSGRSSHTDRDGGDKGEDERKKVKEKKGFCTCLSSQLELGFRRSTDLEPPGA